MSKMSFLDKLGIFYNVSTNSIIHIILLVIITILGIILLTTNKKTKRRNKKIYIIFTISILSVVILTYHSSLINIFDYMMNNFFIAIYFPNLAIYLAAIIATNIILWISIFNNKTSEIIKRINIIVYIIISYLLFLILSIINNDNLDIFTQKSVYSNEKASALIELSSIIFIVWILFLIAYKLILKYLKKDEKVKVKKVIVKEKEKILPANFIPKEIPNIIYSNFKSNKKESLINPITILNYNNKEQVVIKENKKLEPIFKEEINTSIKDNNLSEFEKLLLEDSSDKIEDNIDIEESNEYVPLEIEERVEEEKEDYLEDIEEDLDDVEFDEFDDFFKEEKQSEIIERDNIIVEPSIMKEEEKEEKRNVLNESLEQALTVDDYKLLLRMLKEQKERDKEEEIRRQEEKREEDKFMELQSLYASVR